MYMYVLATGVEDVPNTLFCVAEGQRGRIVEEAADVHQLHHQEITPSLRRQASSMKRQEEAEKGNRRPQGDISRPGETEDD
jgi:hypothetical protein